MGKTLGESTCRNRRVRHEGSMNNVRFTPESRHQIAVGRCPLCAKSGHQAAYSIISLARSKIEVGMSMPSVFAVFILILISNFVGSRTGRSAGFSPLRTRPV